MKMRAVSVTVMLGVVLVGLAFWFFWPTSTPLTGGGQAPTPSDEGAYNELRVEKQLWYQEERWKEEGWAWRPTSAQLLWAKTQKSALLFVAPIVEGETGQSLDGRIYINGFLVEEAADVDVLIWAPPVSVRVEAEGYHPWDVLLGFKHKGLKELHGRVELQSF
jgi:hypothetical protein